jgi:hypothetical protein
MSAERLQGAAAGAGNRGAGSKGLNIEEGQQQKCVLDLDFAIYSAFEDGNFKQVERELSLGAASASGFDINFQRKNTHTTLLMAAAQHGNLAMVHKLLGMGANPAVRDKKRRTADDYAKAEGYEAVRQAIAAVQRQLRNPPGTPLTAHAVSGDSIRASAVASAAEAVAAAALADPKEPEVQVAVEVARYVQELVQKRTGRRDRSGQGVQDGTQFDFLDDGRQFVVQALRGSPCSPRAGSEKGGLLQSMSELSRSSGGTQLPTHAKKGGLNSWLEDKKRKKQAAVEESGEEYLVALSQKISLRDPLSMKMPMELPVRTIACRHLQCFDLHAFLECQLSRELAAARRAGDSSRKTLWKCPICGPSQPATVNLLSVDWYMKQIVERAKLGHVHSEDHTGGGGGGGGGGASITQRVQRDGDSDSLSDEECHGPEEVMLFADGSWKVVETEQGKCREKRQDEEEKGSDKLASQLEKKQQPRPADPKKRQAKRPQTEYSSDSEEEFKSLAELSKASPTKAVADRRTFSGGAAGGRRTEAAESTATEASTSTRLSTASMNDMIELDLSDSE